MVINGWLVFVAFWVALKLSLKRGQVLAAEDFLYHLRMLLAKIIDRVIIMRLVFINCLGVSAESAWSAMFAYSLTDVIMFTMGRAWL